MPLQYIKHTVGHEYKNIDVDDVATSMILIMADMNLYKVVKKFKVIIDKDTGRMLGDATNDIIVCLCDEKGDILDNEAIVARFE